MALTCSGSSHRAVTRAARSDPAATSVFNRGKRSMEIDLRCSPQLHEHLLALIDRAEMFVESWRPGHRGMTRTRLRECFTRETRRSCMYRSQDSASLPVTRICPDTNQSFRRSWGACPIRSLTVKGLCLSAFRSRARALHHWQSSVRSQRFGGHGETAMVGTSTPRCSTARWRTTPCCGASPMISLPRVRSAPSVSQVTPTMRLLTRSFECADGEYLGIHTGAVGAFGRAMRVLGLDDRIPPSEDGMDIGVPLAPEQIPILMYETVDIFKSKPRAEWVRLFLEADVCAVEHLHATEVYDTPQARHNAMVINVDDPVLGQVEQVAPAIKFSETPAFVRGAAPRVGEHTDAVLDTLAGWPVLEGRVTRLPDRRPLLADVRILDFGAYYAGPYSSRLLADLGADVVKIEPLLGDPLRGIERPFFSAQAGKRAMAANLKDRALRQVKQRLLERADVVHHNLRPGAAERLGLDYASISAANPNVIYLDTPGWGSTGPFASRQSFAPMLSGYAGVTYEIAGRFNPPMPPTANEDPGNGLLGAVAILMALVHRDRTGLGQAIENPQLNATMGHMAHAVRGVDGSVVGVGRLDPLQMGFGPFERLYLTSDGWVCVVAYTESERAALAKQLGVERVQDEERQGDLLALALSIRTTKEALIDVRAAGVTVAEPVGHNVHTFMNDPHQRQVGRVAETGHPQLGVVRELHALITCERR